jgi:hypothetical protein
VGSSSGRGQKPGFPRVRRRTTQGPARDWDEPSPISRESSRLLPFRTGENGALDGRAPLSSACKLSKLSRPGFVPSAAYRASLVCVYKTPLEAILLLRRLDPRGAKSRMSLSPLWPHRDSRQSHSTANRYIASEVHTKPVISRCYGRMEQW